MMTVMEIKHLENKVFIIWGKGMKFTHEIPNTKNRFQYQNSSNGIESI